MGAMAKLYNTFKHLNMKLNKNYEIKINLPENVQIEKKKETLFISGPLGFTELNLKKLDPDGIGAISFEKNEDTNNVATLVPTKKKLLFCTNSKAFFGCVSSLIQNKIHGVTRGFLVYIRIVGVGYRAQLQGLDKQNLYLKLGFSHDIKFELPTSIRAFLLEPTLICIYGIDKNQVTQTASKIKQIKVPSVYKGKGIRLAHETIYLKAGKRR
jgi:large subunit ribosomal protein L6